MEDKNNKQISTTQNKEMPLLDSRDFIPRQLSKEEFSVLWQNTLKASALNSLQIKDFFAAMYEYFQKNNFALADIELYRNTYWRLFVRLGWKLLSQLQTDFVIGLVTYTLPYAVAENIDVKKEFADSFVFFKIEEGEMIHKGVKEKIKISDYPLTLNEAGRSITLAQLAAQIETAHDNKEVLSSEMMNKMQNAFFPDETDDSEETKKYKADMIAGFVELMSFFVKDTRLAPFVDKYFTEKYRPYQNLIVDEKMKAEIGKNLLEEYFTPDNEVENTEVVVAKEEISFLTELPKHKTDFIGWVTNASVLRSLLFWLGTFENKAEARKELAKQMETVLGNDSLTNNDLILAIAHLDEFLAKNGYAGDDFFHFEESDGTFKWGK